MDCPCRNCNDRFVGCHSDCERYDKYKTDLRFRNDTIKKERDKLLIGYTTDAVNKNIKKNRINKPKKHYGS